MFESEKWEAHGDFVDRQECNWFFGGILAPSSVIYQKDCN